MVAAFISWLFHIFATIGCNPDIVNGVRQVPELCLTGSSLGADILFGSQIKNEFKKNRYVFLFRQIMIFFLIKF